jgi:hypothetical protein
MVTLTSTVATLTDMDKEMAKQQATQQCGGNANDQQCMAERTSKLEQSILQQRVAEQNSSDKAVKGRRLTVTVVDDSGKEKTVMIPDGQQFKMGNPPMSSRLPSMAGVMSTLFTTLWTGVLLLAWVYSVISTYRTLIEAGYVMPAYIATGVAVLIPYSGFFIMIGFFFAKSYISA